MSPLSRSILLVILATQLCSLSALEFINGTRQRKVYDLSGPTFPFDFPFRNDADDVLIIEEVKENCSCTVEGTTKREYMPGEEGVVSVSIKTKRLEFTAQRTVKVSYRVGGGPLKKRTLVMLLHVPRPVEAQQSILLLRYPKGGRRTGIVAEQDLYQNPRLPCQVTGLDTTGAPSFEVNLVTADGSIWRDAEQDGFPVALRVRSKSETIPRSPESVTIHTDYPHERANKVKFRIHFASYDDADLE